MGGIGYVTPLKPEKAYPADPEEGYGWEKLIMEKLWGMGNKPDPSCTLRIVWKEFFG